MRKAENEERGEQRRQKRRKTWNKNRGGVRKGRNEKGIKLERRAIGKAEE
jgi:hypothetical protein